MKTTKWFQYIYKVKEDSDFRFNEEGDLLKEVTIIANNKVKAFNILKESYPHFRPKQIYLHKTKELKGLFQ